MDMPFAIQQEKPLIREDWEALEVLSADPFPRLKAWLAHRGLDAIPPREERRNTIHRRMVRRGLWTGWQRLKSEIRCEWYGWVESDKKVCGNIRFGRRVKTELLWRLAEPLMLTTDMESQEVRNKVKATTVAASEEGMEFLPPWMRWVALHPLLHHDEEKVDKDPALQGVNNEYAKSCPNQAAMNWYLAYRGDRKAIQEFFKQVSTKWSEEVKRTDKKPGGEVTEEEQENVAHVMSLREMLGVA